MIELELEALPRRGVWRNVDGVPFAVPVYFYRWPWAVIPFLPDDCCDTSEETIDESAERCQVVDASRGLVTAARELELSGEEGRPLFFSPISSDAAIVFVLEVAGLRLRDNDHNRSICRRLRAAMARIVRKPVVCRACNEESPVP